VRCDKPERSRLVRRKPQSLLSLLFSLQLQLTIFASYFCSAEMKASIQVHKLQTHAHTRTCKYIRAPSSKWKIKLSKTTEEFQTNTHVLAFCCSDDKAWDLGAKHDQYLPSSTNFCIPAKALRNGCHNYCHHVRNAQPCFFVNQLSFFVLAH